MSGKTYLWKPAIYGHGYSRPAMGVRVQRGSTYFNPYPYPSVPYP